MCYVSFGVIFFLSYIFFDCGPVFRGDTQAIEQKPIRFPATNLYAKSLDKKMFKNNHYSRSLQDPENWWCVLVQFEIFEQILGTVKDS